MRQEDTYAIQAMPVMETQQAVLFELIEGDQVWVPKSVIHEDSEVWKEGQEPGELVVKHWFAKKEGWSERD